MIDLWRKSCYLLVLLWIYDDLTLRNEKKIDKSEMTKVLGMTKILTWIIGLVLSIRLAMLCLNFIKFRWNSLMIIGPEFMPLVDWFEILKMAMCLVIKLCSDVNSLMWMVCVTLLCIYVYVCVCVCVCEFKFEWSFYILNVKHEMGCKEAIEISSKGVWSWDFILW